MNADLCERAKEFLKLYSEAIDDLGLCSFGTDYVHIESRNMYSYFSAFEWTLFTKPENELRYYVLHAYYETTKFVVLLNDEEYKNWLENLGWCDGENDFAALGM